MEEVITLVLEQEIHHQLVHLKVIMVEMDWVILIILLVVAAALVQLEVMVVQPLVEQVVMEFHLQLQDHQSQEQVVAVVAEV